jgi:monothiol glutaredoxin
VAFETVNVLADPALREGIKEFSDWPTIPQLYVKGEFVGGADIVRELHQKGELRAMLAGVGPAVAAPTIQPKLTVTAVAAAALRDAEGDPGDVLRFSVSARFEHELWFGPAEPGDVVVEANGVAFRLDPASAGRADGTSIDFVDGPAGKGFKIDNPHAPPAVRSISPVELKALLDGGTKVHLVDVRTEGEFETARIEGARLLDADYEAELAALPKDVRLIFTCHHGVRSRAAAERFLSRGHTDVWNLTGGIDAYSRVDPRVPRY